MKACAQCGGSFTPHPRTAARQLFCSTRCARKSAPSYNVGRRNPWVERPCRHCGETFVRASDRAGARRYCSDACKKAAVRERAAGAHRWAHLASRYGVTPESIEQMMVDQNGGCAICRRLLAGKGLEPDSPQVDHDHATGQVRAILCRPCNTALGMFRDDPVLVERAAKYLRDHGAVGTPIES